MEYVEKKHELVEEKNGKILAPYILKKEFDKKLDDSPLTDFVTPDETPLGGSCREKIEDRKTNVVKTEEDKKVPGKDDDLKKVVGANTVLLEASFENLSPGGIILSSISDNENLFA